MQLKKILFIALSLIFIYFLYLKYDINQKINKGEISSTKTQNFIQPENLKILKDKGNNNDCDAINKIVLHFMYADPDNIHEEKYWFYKAIECGNEDFVFDSLISTFETYNIDTYEELKILVNNKKISIENKKKINKLINSKYDEKGNKLKAISLEAPSK